MDTSGTIKTLRVGAERRLYWLFEQLPRRARRSLVGVAMPNYVLAVTCIISAPDGRVLVSRSAYRNAWVFPGGLVDRNEEPDDAIRREVREEVGIDVKLSGGPITLIDPESRRMDFLYTGTASTLDVVLNPAEMDDYRWLDPGAVEAFARSHPSMIGRKMAIASGDATLVVVDWDEVDDPIYTTP